MKYDGHIDVDDAVMQKWLHNEPLSADDAARCEHEALHSNQFVLSTGRTFYSCSNRLSLDERGRLGYGHDSEVDEFDDAPLTPAEKKEIASEMISRWMNWASVKWTSDERLAKAVCFDAIPACTRYPAGVCISKIEAKNGQPISDMWMIIDPGPIDRVLTQRGNWIDAVTHLTSLTTTDDESAEFTLDEAFAACAKLRSQL